MDVTEETYCQTRQKNNIFQQNTLAAISARQRNVIMPCSANKYYYKFKYYIVLNDIFYLTKCHLCDVFVNSNMSYKRGMFIFNIALSTPKTCLQYQRGWLRHLGHETAHNYRNTHMSATLEDELCHLLNPTSAAGLMTL